MNPPTSAEFYFFRPPYFRINSVGRFVGAVGMLIFFVGVLAFLIMLVLGGVEWVTSGGDKASLQHARERMLQALLGLIIMSLGLAFILLLEFFFGITIVGPSILPRAYPTPIP